MKKKLGIYDFGASMLAVLICCIFIFLTLRFIEIGLPIQVIKNDTESWIQENMLFHEQLFELYGWYNKIVGKTSIVNKGEIYVKLENDQLVFPTKEVETETKAQKVKDLSDFCADNEVEMLYVNFPSKLFSDEELRNLGYETYTNQNADYFIENLFEKDVTVLDIRESIKQQDVDFYSLFYKTDHHWNTEAGLFAAREIVDKLNKEYEFKLDNSLLSNEKFSRCVYEECWLGEVGRVMTKTYSGFDDFVLIEPLYETSLRYDVNSYNMHLNGDFSILLDEDMYSRPNNNVYNTSWHYSYMFANYGEAIISNNNNNDGVKILLIKDSFSLVVAPYLALPSAKVTCWDIRTNEQNIYEHILSEEYDIVIVAYTQTTIIKDNMFDFDGRHN